MHREWPLQIHMRPQIVSRNPRFRRKGCNAASDFLREEVPPLLLFAMVETQRVLGTNRRGGPNFSVVCVYFPSVPRSASRTITCVSRPLGILRNIYRRIHIRACGVVVLRKRHKIRRVNCTRRAISVCPSKCVASSSCGLSPFQINSAAGFPLSDRQRLEGKTFIRSVSDRCGISYHTTLE